MKLIQIGVNFREKKLNPTLREWKRSGYNLVWKKRYEDDTSLQRSCKLTKDGNYRKSCLKNIKRRYFDVYVEPKLFKYKKTEYDVNRKKYV